MSDLLAIIKAFTDAIAVKDYDTAGSFMTETCEYTNIPLASVTGPAGMRAVLEPFFAPTLENEFVLIRTLVDGNRVCTERLDRHRLASGWVELPVAGIFEFDGDKISVWREYFDAATIVSKWPTA
ncbi:hypothetical protein IP88_08330 [alpha proteobacterium AAP81b]|nr:hypothetical protein IP88_08330 [alpha proteobacterium AAP81b]